MSGDLIPPPSPAGRPTPDPEPSAHAEPLLDAPPEPAPAPVGPSQFRTRFGFVTGALLGCAVAAGAVLLTLLTTGGGPEQGVASNWSTWQPASSEPFTGASQIAQHVGPRYRDREKKQLVSVTGGPVSLGNVPLSIALRPPDGDVQVLAGLGVQYTLNGLGNGGAIEGGKASRTRARLLRREGLELALYSFRYLPDVTMVVALLPPEKVEVKKADKADDPKFRLQALLYRPTDLQPQLDVPLDVTISPTAPPTGGLEREEARRVDSLTLSNLFRARITQAQDARAYLVLERPS